MTTTTYYIATDRDETAIYGTGTTAEDAILEARDLTSYDSAYKAHPCTPALFEQVVSEGGLISWGYLDRRDHGIDDEGDEALMHVACTVEEEEADCN